MNPAFNESGADQGVPKPKKVGIKEPLADVIMKLKDRLRNQSKDFGYDPKAVSYRDDNGDRQLQADVNFQDTRFESAFDRALVNLTMFARSGTDQNNWRTSRDSESYGKYRIVELPNGHKYGVVDETPRLDDPIISVGIRNDFARGLETRDEPHEEGNYYITFDTRTGTRRIEICGASNEFGVSGVMEDIATVVKKVSPSP